MTVANLAEHNAPQLQAALPGVPQQHTLQYCLSVSLSARVFMLEQETATYSTGASVSTFSLVQKLPAFEQKAATYSTGALPEWPVAQNPLTCRCTQAKQDKFKAAVDRDSAGSTVEEHTPLLVDRRNPFKPLDPEAPLQSSVLKEPVLEFAAIFSSIRLLPTAVANAVPSQASGAALAPPAAFQVTTAVANAVPQAPLWHLPLLSK